MRLLPLLALLASAASCTFTTRSEQFACTTNDDCGGGRVCESSWCVVPGAEPDAAPPADADPSAPDADPTVPDATPADAGPFVCPPECTNACLDGTCDIICNAAGSCPLLQVCPPGIPCKVECNGDGSCAGGVDCSAASSCVIECTNLNTCASVITCGTGRCRVECGGASSCTGGINCLDACQCDTFCTGTGSCTPLGPMCPGTAQCTNAPDCTSIPGPCNTC